MHFYACLIRHRLFTVNIEAYDFCLKDENVWSAYKREGIDLSSLVWIQNLSFWPQSFGAYIFIRNFVELDLKISVVYFYFVWVTNTFEIGIGMNLMKTS